MTTKFDRFEVEAFGAGDDKSSARNLKIVRLFSVETLQTGNGIDIHFNLAATARRHHMLLQHICRRYCPKLSQTKDEHLEGNMIIYTARHSSSYGASRSLAKVVSFLGWCVATAGAIGFLVQTVQLFKQLSRYGGRIEPLELLLSFLLTTGVYLSLATLMFGLLIVAAGQVTRAIVDTADYNGEMLTILRTRTQEMLSLHQEEEQL